MVKKAVKKIFHLFGLELIKRNPRYIDRLFFILKQIDFKPAHIVDVGANHGMWTRRALEYFPDAYYTLLEPQAWLKSSFSDLLDRYKKINFHGVGAGEKEGTFNFTINSSDVSSSFIYSEEEAMNMDFKQVKIPVVTLNNLLANSNLPSPDIIKVDAEGVDIEVLKGASNFLGSTEVILIEASIVHKQFQNSIFEVITFMDKSGYKLFDLTDHNWAHKDMPVLWLVEAVFVKKGGFIDSYPFSYR